MDDLLLWLALTVGLLVTLLTMFTLIALTFVGVLA